MLLLQKKVVDKDIEYAKFCWNDLKKISKEEREVIQ